VGEALFLDTIFHLFALGVAIRYGIKNRRWMGVVLAAVSPIVFLFFVQNGPHEKCDFFGTCPTDVGLFMAYAWANLVLAAGLFLTAFPRAMDLLGGEEAVDL